MQQLAPYAISLGYQNSPIWVTADEVHGSSCLIWFLSKLSNMNHLRVAASSLGYMLSSSWDSRSADKPVPKILHRVSLSTRKVLDYASGVKTRDLISGHPGQGSERSAFIRWGRTCSRTES